MMVALFCTTVDAAETVKVNDGFKISSNDWPWWRGPGRNGEASTDQSPPLTWNENQNVVWKVAISGWVTKESWGWAGFSTITQ